MTRPDSTSILSWIFQKNDERITCLLQRSGADRSYRVCIVPHSDVTSAVVEESDTPLGAFCRHAQIAMRLRSAGWCVIARSR